MYVQNPNTAFFGWPFIFNLQKKDPMCMYAMMISFHLLPNLPGNISGFDSVMCLF